MGETLHYHMDILKAGTLESGRACYETIVKVLLHKKFHKNVLRNFM